MIDFQQKNWERWLNRWFLPLLATGIVVNIASLFVTVLDTDGTLYAMIAKTMAQTGDYVNLKVEGKDWLDKPHFPFWMAAISYQLFGVTSFAYKLPALLFWGLGAWYTFLLAQKIHNKTTAQIAVLLYLCATHLVVSNNDVRAEPYLTGLIIGSVYHFYQASFAKWGKHVVLGALLTACAVMTKGPFVLITILGGFVVDWLLKKDYQQFLQIRWWLALALIGIFILPEMYCLYTQFDLHPEKIVFDKTGVSGLKFFFWDSQFGRFFNTGPIKGDGDKFFYIHTLLWALLPWSLLFYAAIYWRIKTFNNRILHTEHIVLLNALITLLIFSLSKFQLPHYTNILFPFFAIITAQYLAQMQQPSGIKAIGITQFIVLVLMLVVVALLWVVYRPTHSVSVVALWIITIVVGYWAFKKGSLPHIFGASFCVAMGVYTFINQFFYPDLLQYQSGSNAAFFANEHYPQQPVYLVNASSYSFTLYSNSNCIQSNLAQLPTLHSNQKLVIYTEKKHLDSLVAQGFSVQQAKDFPFFHASQLTGEFLNTKTRQQTLKTYVVAAISKQ